MLFWAVLACLVVYAPYYIPLLLIWKLLKWFIKWLFKPREWLPYENPKISCMVEVDEKAERQQRKKEQRQAIARTTIEYYEPQRKELLERIKAAELTNNEKQLQSLKKQLYTAEIRLQKAHFDLED